MGKHPFQLYSQGTPNGVKVTVLLEELLAAGHAAEYDAWLIRIGKGDQFGSGFVEVNPNSKIPALMDRSAPRRSASSKAPRSSSTLPRSSVPSDKGCPPEMLSWLFWQMGSAPYLGGGFGTSMPTRPRNGSTPSTATRWRRSASSMCSTGTSRRTNGWRAAPTPFATSRSGRGTANWRSAGSTTRASSLDVKSYHHVVEWAERIDARPAVKRGRMVNRTSGERTSSFTNATTPRTSRPARGQARRGGVTDDRIAEVLMDLAHQRGRGQPSALPKPPGRFQLTGAP